MKIRNLGKKSLKEVLDKIKELGLDWTRWRVGGSFVFRKLGRDNKHRRSMLATLTKQVIMNERIKGADTRAKEVCSTAR